MSDEHLRVPLCSLCSVARAPERRALPEGLALGSTGERVLVMVQTDLDEVLVAPVEHVAMIGALDEPGQGELLGALRRVADLMRSRGGTVAVEPTRESASSGHLCIRVVRTVRDETARRFGDARALARRPQS